MTVSDSSLDDTHLPHPAPPPAPRALSSLVRQRSWSERHVRIWWMLGLILLAISCYYAFSRYYFWNQETSLIQHGEKLQGEVMGWSPGMDAPKDKVVNAQDAVDVRYEYRGQIYRSYAPLAGRTQQIKTRSMIPIFLDPNHPERWTARTQPASLIHEMLSAMILFPFAVVLFVMALFRRRKVLAIYQNGDATVGEVVGVQHSAAAPLSRFLRCAVHVGDQVRVIKVLLPARVAPDIGQGLWLIAPPGRTEQAIPAALFE